MVFSNFVGIFMTLCSLFWQIENLKDTSKNLIRLYKIWRVGVATRKKENWRVLAVAQGCNEILKSLQRESRRKSSPRNLWLSAAARRTSHYSAVPRILKKFVFLGCSEEISTLMPKHSNLSLLSLWNPRSWHKKRETLGDLERIIGDQNRTIGRKNFEGLLWWWSGELKNLKIEDILI